MIGGPVFRIPRRTTNIAQNFDGIRGSPCCIRFKAPLKEETGTRAGAGLPPRLQELIDQLGKNAWVAAHADAKELMEAAGRAYRRCEFGDLHGRQPMEPIEALYKIQEIVQRGARDDAEATELFASLLLELATGTVDTRIINKCVGIMYDLGPQDLDSLVKGPMSLPESPRGLLAQIQEHYQLVEFDISINFANNTDSEGLAHTHFWNLEDDLYRQVRDGEADQRDGSLYHRLLKKLVEGAKASKFPSVRKKLVELLELDLDNMRLISRDWKEKPTWLLEVLEKSVSELRATLPPEK